jgi:phosphoribosyl 1,2-cyclic phosphodiesterase
MQEAAIHVSFWGTRGSIATPGRTTEKYGGNTPCVFVECAGASVILDAGTGIRKLGLALARRGKPLDLHLFLSHTHWDHIQGLPFFAPIYHSGNRLTIYGSARKEMFLESVLHRQMDENYFPVQMTDLAGAMSIVELDGREMRIGPMTVQCLDQDCHPGGGMAYSLSAGGRRIVYATDFEVDRLLASPSASVPTLGQFSRFLRNADLYIADTQYTEAEYGPHAGWGHGSIPSVLKIAQAAGVRQVAAFHHEPEHSDAMLDGLEKAFGSRYAAATPPMTVFWAREGMSVRL